MFAVQSLVTTASKDSLGGELPGSESSIREELREDLSGNSSSIFQRHSVPENSNLTNPESTAAKECQTKLVPPSISKQQYNKICTTHKRLVKSGVVKCSISLSDTPPDSVDLPSAPTSPLAQSFVQLEGSVHFGAVGEFSGVHTPSLTPVTERISVITSVPPPVPPRRVSSVPHVLPLSIDPAVKQPVSLPKLSSPTLLQGVAALLKNIPSTPPGNNFVENILDNIAVQQQNTPRSSNNQLVPRRLSSTDPNYLQYRIPIVSTSVSSLDSFASEVFQTNHQQLFSEPTTNSGTMDIFNKEARYLVNLRRDIERELMDLTEEDVCSSRVHLLEGELGEIKKLKNTYLNGVEDFIERYQHSMHDPRMIERFKVDIPVVGREVKEHAGKIRDKKEALFPINQLTASERESLEIQRATLKLQELIFEEKKDAYATRAQEKSEEDKVLAETEANLFLGECSVLGDMMIDETWEAVEDDEISSAMRSLSKWQEQWNCVERSYRKYENMAVKHKFPETRREAVKATYDDRKDRFENTRDDLKTEDTVRGLFTLEPARTDIMKYPSFSGSPSDDYMKFKETMEQRFRENKVRRKEQVAKLRECLKGVALARVPDGITDVVEAFKRLSEAFGNPNKIMAFNLKALDDIGTLPPEKIQNGQYNYAKRIEWFLKLEVILSKILDLSSRSSKLSHEAFASSTYRKLWSRFPTSVIDKLVKVPGEDSERFEGILNKLVKMRQHAQVMDDECGNANEAGAKKNSDAHTTTKMTIEVFFRPAQRFEDCRICIHLSSTSGSHGDLFDNHLSNYLTGCPKFVEATTEMRKTLVNKVQTCPQCFHPDIIFTRDHIKDCPFSKKKNNYSCQNRNCREHMWICLQHKSANKLAMQKFRTDLLQSGHNLAFTSDLSMQATPASAQSLGKAEKRLSRGEKKKGAETVPVPEGEPLFMFHAAQGRTAPVNTFYDSGCSHAVFQEGIPVEQFRAQLVSKGPFNIDGVAGLKTIAMDEWLVSVPRTDGKYQHIQGLTVPRITSDFPLINLEAATREAKDDDPTNLTLQNCKVPPLAGGSVHMLLGIMYLSIFPKEIHTLPSGLTVYQSRLASHGGKYDCCIGGPHSSFAALSDIAGGTARLLAHFMDGLKVFREWGPPKIRTICMTEEEAEFARTYNCAEGEMNEFAQLMLEEEVDLVNIVEDSDTDNMYTAAEHNQAGDELHDTFICCDHCTGNVTAQVANDERIRDFKRFQEIHETGLEVEYRCPRCRECNDCKSADKTEKISLREESEMYEIRKSVQLDFDNKKIQCTLPLRGKERDFLTNNKDKAEKILYQQCKKYYDDTEAKKVIIAAFDKLFNNGHAKLLNQLSPEELDEFIHKEVQHHIPWRVVFSKSLTTPCRPILDASSRTAFRKDKSGGRCLNDLVCKGKVESLNLIKVLLRFIIGLFGFTGELQQFYNACKLLSKQWNLQRFLWVKVLDPDGEVLEAVILTLIYGVKSVSAQSEHALTLLADHIREENPELAMFLVLSRYVDDLQDSKSSQEECITLTRDADELFEKVGLKCKAWTVSGLPPSPIVSKDGLSVGVFGVFGWFSEGDIIEFKFHRLHFANPKRGRLSETVKFFEGNSEEEMDKFVPDPLTRRQVASKMASICDYLGKLTPHMPGPKLDLRETFQRTESWDSGMPFDLRQKWVKNFWIMENLRGLKFNRAVMPSEAVDNKLRVLTGVDAAKEALVMGCWGGFKLKDGTYSNQLLLGRSLLSKNESIPKSELDALCGGSNMAWVVRLALQEWFHSHILFSDSEIALCWLTSEKLRLSLFHRNRVLQIRRGTSLDCVYHVRTEHNPADCGTRPSKVKLSDVGQDSRWENGDPWMKMEIAKAVTKGFIRPASELRVSKDIEEDFNEGLMFSDRDEVLTRGHPAKTVHIVSETRVKKLQERAEFSKYLLLPTKYSFPATVRIYGYVFCFVRNARKGKQFLGDLLKEAKLWFSIFSCDLKTANINSVKVVSKLDRVTDMPSETRVLGHFTVKKLVFSNTEDQRECILTDKSLHQALLYIFRKGTLEVKQFVSKKVIKRIACEADGILLSRGRLLDGMNFVETGELGDFNLGSLGVKVNTPVLERFSPISYSIAQHIHWTVGKHRGIETSNRLSLEHVSIIQGMTLYRELAEECIKCHMKRKKFVEVPMGPIAQEQLMVAPPFYVTMIDLFGPLKSYVPGYERETRNRPALESKLHVMVAVCVTTKIVNLQVLEGKSAAAIIDGFTKLSCEVGVPSMVHVDQDSGALAGFQTVELDYTDLQHKLWTQFGISFSTCPVGGHDQHGLVERIIKSIQETFDDCGLRNSRIHATGWQTFCKLAENAYNNLPIGYSYSRYQDNTELLKILTPNMLRVGRINSRALQSDCLSARRR